MPSGAVYSLPLRVRRATYDPLGAETITLAVRSLDDPASPRRNQGAVPRAREMNMQTIATVKQTGFNPVFWIMWLLPGRPWSPASRRSRLRSRTAIVPLPEDYHWEGARLDADFTRARAAAAHRHSK